MEKVKFITRPRLAAHLMEKGISVRQVKNPFDKSGEFPNAWLVPDTPEVYREIGEFYRAQREAREAAEE